MAHRAIKKTWREWLLLTFSGKLFIPSASKGTLRKEPCARLKIPKWFLMAPKKAPEFRQAQLSLLSSSRREKVNFWTREALAVAMRSAAGSLCVVWKLHLILSILIWRYMPVFKGSGRQTPSDHVTVNIPKQKTKGEREREQRAGLRASLSLFLSPTLGLQIQSGGEISPGIILTERWVNLRGTFKTDLGSSLSPLTPSSTLVPLSICDMAVIIRGKAQTLLMRRSGRRQTDRCNVRQ